MRQYLRGGLITVIKVVEAADKGDEIADAALREVGAELFDQPSGRTGEIQIIAYLQRAPPAGTGHTSAVAVAMV